MKIRFLLATAIALIILNFFVTPYMFAASVSYAFICFGLFLKRKLGDDNHAKLMICGISIDLALVLILEFQRNAVETAINMDLSPLQMSHIAASSIAAALYFPILILGFMLWKRKVPRDRFLPWHINLGVAAFIFRTIGFILMFSLLPHVSQ